MSSRRLMSFFGVVGLVLAIATFAQAQTVVEPLGPQQGLGRQQQQSRQDFDARSYSPYYDGSQGRRPEDTRRQFRQDFDTRSYASPYYDWSQGLQPEDVRPRFRQDLDPSIDTRSYASPYYDWSQGRRLDGFDRQDSFDRRFDTRFDSRRQGMDRQRLYDPRFDTQPYSQWDYDRRQGQDWQGMGRQYRPGLGDRRFDTRFDRRWEEDRWQSLNRPYRQDSYDRRLDTRPYGQWDSNRWQWQDQWDSGRQGFDQGFGSPSRQWPYGQEQADQFGGQFQQGRSPGTGTQQQGTMRGGTSGGQAGGGASSR